jgi:Protein of unknown function (DUF2510)
VDADWYPDPSSPSQQRFWDGVSWTIHIYGPNGQGTDAGLADAPAPGAAADFPVSPPPSSPPPSFGPPPQQAPSSPPPSFGPPPQQAPGGYSWPGPPSYPPPGGPASAPPGYGPPPYGPPVGGYGYAPGGSYASSAGHGPIGRPTSPGIQILLTIVTLGIWALVWTYRQYRDMHDYSGVGIGGVLGLLINFVPFWGSLVTYFLLPNEVHGLYEREGRPSPVSGVYGLFVLIPLVGTLIWYILVQRAINDFWIAHGAPPP